MVDIPTCFHLGTQRAGSTYLYNLLAQHPGAALSRIKEVNFYTVNYEKGVDWYVGTFGKGIRRIDTSVKYFMKGQIAALRIRKMLNGRAPRFLIILRNPIDYVHSHYQTQLRSGYFKEQRRRYPVLPTTIISFLNRYPEYAERGRYWYLLEKYWLKHFGMRNFKFVAFEQFIRDTSTTVNEICSFFGLEIRKLAAVETSKHKLLNHPMLYRGSKCLDLFPRLKKFLKENWVMNILYEKVLTSRPPRLAEEERVALGDFFVDDVRRLCQETDVDVSLWTDFGIV